MVAFWRGRRTTRWNRLSGCLAAARSQAGQEQKGTELTLAQRHVRVEAKLLSLGQRATGMYAVLLVTDAQ